MQCHPQYNNSWKINGTPLSSVTCTQYFYVCHLLCGLYNCFVENLLQVSVMVREGGFFVYCLAGTFLKSRSYRNSFIQYQVGGFKNHLKFISFFGCHFICLNKFELGFCVGLTSHINNCLCLSGKFLPHSGLRVDLFWEFLTLFSINTYNGTDV